MCNHMALLGHNELIIDELGVFRNHTNIFAFSFMSLCWDGVDSWNHSLCHMTDADLLKLIQPIPWWQHICQYISPVRYSDGYKPWPWISAGVSVVHLSCHQAGTTCQLPFLIPSIKRRVGWYQHSPHLIELYGQTQITGRTLLSRVG